MPYPIVECSPKARAMIAEGVVPLNDAIKTNTKKYPFDALEIGAAFTVPFSENNELSIRQLKIRYGKKLKRSFTVIKHNEHQLIEVARIG